MDKKKRLLAVIIAVGAMLTGCQLSGSDSSSDTQDLPDTGSQTDGAAQADPVSEEITGCFGADDIGLPMGITHVNDIYKVTGGFVIYGTDSNYYDTVLHRANSDLTTYTDVLLEMPEEYTSADAGYYYISADPDGTICSLFTVEDHGGVKLPEQDDPDFDYESYYDDFESELYFSKFSLDGKCLSTVKVDAEKDEYGSFDIYNFIGYGDGLLACRDMGELIRISEDGSVETLYAPEDPSYGGYANASIMNSPTGLIYSYYGEETTSSGTYENFLRLSVIDPETGSVSEPFYETEGTGSSFDLSKFSPGTEEFPVFLCTEESLLGVRLDGSTQELINWGNSSLSPMRCLPLSEGNFLGIEYSSESQNERLLKLFPIDPSELQDLTTLDLYGYVSRETVNAFNRSQNKYRINIKDFNYEYDSKESMSQQMLNELNLDIASGKTPDIIFDLPISVQINLQNKGVFADISPFLESDSNINEKTVMPNVLKALETSDGKIYCLPNGFDIVTLLAKSSVCDKENWTFDDMLELYDNAPASADHIYDCYGQDEMIWRMRYVFDDFIDTESSTTSFDSPEFIKVLEFCKRFEEEGVTGNKDSEMEYNNYIMDRESWFKNDRIFLMEESLSLPTDYNFTKSYFADGADLTFVGYPSGNGKGGRIVPIMPMAITESCKDKEGAWEFIKYCINSSNYELTDDGFTLCGGLPIMREGYEDYLDHEMNSEHTASGNPMPALSQADRDMLSEYILSCDTMGSIADDDVISIIMEEAGEFFAGERSAQETAQIIQNRVSILVSERS
ncbi:MAG: extracellular solute-binding protein [Ruminococcus sp.]|nr:extracellular solute-binding protein [Ruminococcus sp.]